MNKISKLSLYLLTALLVVSGLWLLPTRSMSATAEAQVSWPTIELVQYASGLSAPVHITHAGDGSERLFVLEQPGRIRIIQNGTLLPTPFLDIASQVEYGGEQGLVGLAFAPDYPTSGYFYVYYTNKSGDNQVSRFQVSGDPDIADLNSESLVLYLNHPTYDNHNGGQMVFGADGYLYIATGDGGGAGDPLENAQDPASLLGKLLRIDVAPLNPSSGAHQLYLPLVQRDGTDEERGYRIPDDNPYVDTPGYRGEIWALGLRNPWRFSFDRGTGDLFIADVGQRRYEEVNYQPASSPGGENYGWNIMEGFHCYPEDPCDQTGLTLPVVEYDHFSGCSITGGYVYRGGQYPGMQGIYYYGDYCSGRIWGLARDNSSWVSQELLDSSNAITAFGEDQAGELYLADLYSGEIYQVVEATP